MRVSIAGLAPGKKQLSNRVAQARLGYMFLAPTVAAVAVFQYYPAVSAVYHSLTRWDGVDPATFAGFTQFSAFFSDPEFGTAVGNILKLTAFWMVLAVTVPLIVARLILSIPSARQQFICRLLFILPFVVPQVVLILLWQFIYAGDGVLNQILGDVGLANLQTDWLGNPHTALYAIMAMGFPYVDGFGLLVYSAGLQNVSAEIKEAAAMDGAGSFRTFFQIELPQITGQLRLMWILAIIGGIQNFTQILILTQGGPGYTTTVPGLMMYQQAFNDQNMGEACAIGTTLFVIILVLTVVNMNLFRVGGDYEARSAEAAV
jgi:raffinose/stachyose/melibiose transport system permease protein